MFQKLLTAQLLIIIMAASTSAMKLYCHFGKTSLNVIGQTYACYGGCFLDDGDKKVVEINGQHLDKNTNNDVTALMLDDCTDLTFIPKDIDKFFPNLLALRFYDTKIAFLAPDDLIKFPKLQAFMANNNEFLTEIPRGLFSHTPELKFIGLSNNNIQNIYSNLIDTLPNLEFVNLSDNRCINSIASRKQDIQKLVEKMLIQCGQEVLLCGHLEDVERRLCFAEHLKEDMFNRNVRFVVDLDFLKSRLTSIEARPKCTCPTKVYTFEEEKHFE